MATEHQGIKEEAQQTFSMALCEAAHHKPVLCNHHMQHAMFKHKCTEVRRITVFQELFL